MRRDRWRRPEGVEEAEEEVKDGAQDRGDPHPCVQMFSIPGCSSISCVTHRM